MTTITSPQNPRVKNAARLRHGRHRQKQGRILIDGVRELSRAIAAGVVLQEIFVCEKLCRGEQQQQLLDKLPDCGAEILQVDKRLFERLAFGHRGEGVLAVAETPGCALDDLTLPDAPLIPGSPLIAVLEGVEKPGNVGAVLRSADASGVGAVIVADGRTDLFNPNAIRASLGTIFTVPVAEASSEETLAWLRDRQFSVFTARVDGSVVYTEADFTGPSAVVLGSEADGLTDEWSGESVQAVRLPMLGVADSLNVSVTAAVILYEAVRQRT